MKRTSGTQNITIANAESIGPYPDASLSSEQAMDLLDIIRDLDNRLDIAVNGLIMAKDKRLSQEWQLDIINQALNNANPHRKSDNK